MKIKIGELTITFPMNTEQKDQEFLKMMITHHEHAIYEAQEILLSTHNPAVRQLAENIIATQTKEALHMRQLLKK